jgi:hypothetical protein
VASVGNWSLLPCHNHCDIRTSPSLLLGNQERVFYSPRPVFIEAVLLPEITNLFYEPRKFSITFGIFDWNRWNTAWRTQAARARTSPAGCFVLNTAALWRDNLKHWAGWLGFRKHNSTIKMLSESSAGDFVYKMEKASAAMHWTSPLHSNHTDVRLPFYNLYALVGRPFQPDILQIPKQSKYTSRICCFGCIIVTEHKEMKLVLWLLL